MAMKFASTVPFMVGKGTIPQEYRQHAVKLAQKRIKGLLNERDPDGRPVWTEKSIGKRWGLSQATINELKNGGGAKMGLRILLALREMLRTSLDDLLGLPPMNARAPDREDRPKPLILNRKADTQALDTEELRVISATDVTHSLTGETGALEDEAEGVRRPRKERRGR